MPTLEELIEEVIDPQNLSRFSDEELSRLEAAVSAERQERDNEGRGLDAGHPAPAAPSITDDDPHGKCRCCWELAAQMIGDQEGW